MSKLEIIQMKDSEIELKIEGQSLKGLYYLGPSFIDLHLPDGNFRIPLASGKKRASSQHAEGGLQAPMPGKVIKVLVAENEPVKKGDLLLIMEAMKMEHKITSPREGLVKKLFYKEGDRVSQGEDLITIE